MEEDIEQLGKGLAGPDKPDPRDYQLMGASTVTNDFNQPSGLKTPPGKDQGSSLSCTAQAVAYYFWQWTGIDISRQAIYSEIFLPQGGSYFVDGLNELARRVVTLQEHKDPNPQTESKMRVKVNVAGKKYTVTFWRPKQQDIDGIAWAIKNYKGCIGGVNGHNAGWKNKIEPTPPMAVEVEWAHALYFYDNVLSPSSKALIAMSSWFKSAPHHIIKDNYFISGNTFSFWVMEVKEGNLVNEFIDTINNKGKVGVVVYADTVENYKYLCKQYKVDPKIQPDGTITTDITI